MNNEVKMV